MKKLKHFLLFSFSIFCFLSLALSMDANTSNKIIEVNKETSSSNGCPLQFSSFKEINSNTSISTLFELVGSPSHVMGTKPLIYIYHLRDDSQIWIGSNDRQHILYIDHVVHGQLDKRLVGKSDNTVRPASTVPKVSQK